MRLRRAGPHTRIQPQRGTSWHAPARRPPSGCADRACARRPPVCMQAAPADEDMCSPRLGMHPRIRFATSTCSQERIMLGHASCMSQIPSCLLPSQSWSLEMRCVMPWRGALDGANAWCAVMVCENATDKGRRRSRGGEVTKTLFRSEL